jgi:hypothetical protein
MPRIRLVEIDVWITIATYMSPAHGENRMSGRPMLIAALALLAVSEAIAATQTVPTLNYEFFKSRVEPIFLTKRPDHARCYVCHVESNNNFHLEKLSPDAREWSDEQSRRNFEMVEKLVNPGDPDTSRLLLHPLGPEGGGDVFHSGGRQFPSKRDPAWRTLAAFVNGATLASPKP